ncbi:hypothetical protein K32_15960 [Kaistia sp. 32K]|uniref:hypothetical protein n=1 Tax=Kaistia sp. 32K TaxID=2795690 RepID=UPI0019150162|nr:hypothetical protein [Kaistia sp. 32K]BCP52979.1 hypothetical protein K32_15960 [Kaistia sp. 32K]
MLKRFAAIASVLVVVIPTSAAFADGAACSCRHLESIQQELRNAEALIRLQQEIQRKLDAVEAPLIEAKKRPTHPDSDVNIYDRSIRERSTILSRFTLPHPKVKGYSGPASINMPFGTCEQSARDLDALKSGSQCKELADINLAHEAAHRAECQAAGASEYWKRLPSQMAAEEVIRYTEQAAALRKLLKKVLDDGEMTVEAHMKPRIQAPQFDVTYSYDTGPIRLKGKSSPGSDEWSLNGKGVQVVRIDKVRLAGMTCTSSGQTNTNIDMTLQTDGLTMDLDGKSTSAPGDVKITCRGGHGMSMRPQQEVGKGAYFADQEVRTETNLSRDVKEMAFGKILAQGGLSATGKETVKVTLVCPGD